MYSNATHELEFSSAHVLWADLNTTLQLSATFGCTILVYWLWFYHSLLEPSLNFSFFLLPIPHSQYTSGHSPVATCLSVSAFFLDTCTFCAVILNLKCKKNFAMRSIDSFESGLNLHLRKFILPFQDSFPDYQWVHSIDPNSWVTSSSVADNIAGPINGRVISTYVMAHSFLLACTPGFLMLHVCSNNTCKNRNMDIGVRRSTRFHCGPMIVAPMHMLATAGIQTVRKNN